MLKKIFLILIAILFSLNIVNAETFIYDNEDIFHTDNEKLITELLEDHFKKTGIKIKVLTISETELVEESASFYFFKFDLDKGRSKNNLLVILIEKPTEAENYFDKEIKQIKVTRLKTAKIDQSAIDKLLGNSKVKQIHGKGIKEKILGVITLLNSLVSLQDKSSPSPSSTSSIKKCTDGTIYNSCSKNKPLLCKQGKLTKNCQKCKCPEGYECKTDGSCIKNQCITLKGSPDDNSKLDFVFIGDDYSESELTLFAQDVDIFMENLLTYEPFASQKNKINFHRVDNTLDLVCDYDCDGIKRMICCDDSKIKSIITQYCPYDEILVLVNTANYGGSGGEHVSVSYRKDTKVMIHEIGHSFGKLKDEYTYKTKTLSGSPIPINFPGYDEHSYLYGNCDTSATCPLWNNLPGTDCVPGCQYAEWYKPRERNSVMLDLRGDFNPVGIRQLSKRLEAFS